MISVKITLKDGVIEDIDPLGHMTSESDKDGDFIRIWNGYYLYDFHLKDIDKIEFIASEEESKDE